MKSRAERAFCFSNIRSDVAMSVDADEFWGLPIFQLLR